MVSGRRVLRQPGTLATGADRSYREGMLSSSSVSDADAAAVWRTLSDLESWADLLPTIDAVRALAPGRPPGVGSSYVLKQPGMPPMRWTVTSWEPGSSFAWESRSPGVRTIGTHVLRPGADGGTSIELTIDWVGPLAWLASLLAGRKTLSFIEVEARTFADKSRSD
jgi:uncharacterized membrane protein